MKAKVFQHTVTSIEQMQEKITHILRSYTPATLAHITNFRYFTKVENGI